MSNKRPGNWRLVGYSQDPVPGDPERVRKGAQGYTQTAEAIKTAATNLRSISYDQKSKAIDKIREQARTIADELDKAHTRCQGAGETLATYATVLEEARSTTARALRRAEAANGDKEAAVQAQNSAAERYNASKDEVERAGERSTYYRYKGKAEEAQRNVDTASNEVRGAVSRVDAAAKKAAKELGAIRRSSPMNDTVGDHVKNLLKKIKEAIEPILNFIREKLWFISMFSPFHCLGLTAFLTLYNKISPQQADVSGPTHGLRIGGYFKPYDPKGENLDRSHELNTAGDIVRRIWDMDKDDGLRLEEIRCADKKTRYVLYIAGSAMTKDDTMMWSENPSAYVGVDTKTDERIRKLLRDKVHPSNEEIMVAGYSQGGLHAMNLVNTGEFNVTQVLTVNSPNMAPPIETHGAQILHISDKRDTIVSHIPGASSRNTDRYWTTSTKGEEAFIGGAHADESANVDIAEQWYKSRDPDTMKHRERVMKFLGGVTQATYD